MFSLHSTLSRQESLPVLSDKSPSWRALSDEAADLLGGGTMSFDQVLRLSNIAVGVQCLLQERCGDRQVS